MANFRRVLHRIPGVLNSSPFHSRVTAPTSPIHSQFLRRHSVGSILRFYSSNQSLDVDFSNEESKRRLCNRLLYRSRQRGFLELDLILGKWVEEHIHSMDENGIKSLVNVLDQENPDLWKWVTDQEKPPESIEANPVFAAVRENVIKNLNNHAAPETRANPGRSWVRGWDDFKKGRDSPVSGNQ
ncbi:succinate dehydrogenase assembly factor 2, mitochondrial isoform X7 [Diospyros lotus]|uniref:succinate dehydrogenase assembly factor 2, mitochondrial isoform X4 n=1 Tax=Diospyros lotus TaxID=55363 RepID=UPI0022587C58|nr:succinate dehydrogenase assembly factor 2, mitochondrial isoform X4 [Diospyros lotus]XP_052175833.1 succinate dehydrogenase assembly factor 2, mitochondrial isoform X5 [Diospyros lotus]XP_052175834.1 succinate dehydrogenase assembly factor 2, mitochondrial isoform X6 [Diospyros lotus]XP_052175835.1 succinate dehydrogenase assembly factor 2, mitochondrial isoform X7 [Diospyros lotus]